MGVNKVNSKKSVEFDPRQLEADAIIEGSLQGVTGNELKVLMVISAFGSKTGVSFPSQRTISEVAGMSVPTVNKAINDMVERGVLTRELEGERRKTSSYVIKPLEPVQDPPKATMTPKDAVKLFCTEYELAFDVPYKPVWGRDIGMMKQMTDVYTDEQLTAIIKTAVGQYERRWANTRYPRPSIGQITSWLGNTALTVWQEEIQGETSAVRQASKVDVTAFDTGAI